MKPVKTIAPQSWMKSPESRAVMAALNSEGTPEAKALFVGGCVRAALLGEPVTDIDIATHWRPEEVMQRLESAGIKKVVPTGLQHGTVTAVTGGKPFEITTLRKDVKTDGRRAVVAFTADWKDDAQRRDFTMNTLLADAQGHIFDPLGTGLKDLEAGRVVFVGDPARRIAEDYLRILRFFRFHALYGKGAPDEAALAACRASADKIKALSRERITQEFFKILTADRAAETLDLIRENAILPDLLSKIPCNHHPRAGRDPWTGIPKHIRDDKKTEKLSLSARLFLLTQELDAETVNEFLLIPKGIRQDMKAISEVMGSGLLDTDHAVKVALYKHGRAAAKQAALIQGGEGALLQEQEFRALEIIQNWQVPVFPLSGEDLLKAGMSPGPKIGKTLSRIEKWWIGEGFSPDRRQCLGRIEHCL